MDEIIRRDPEKDHRSRGISLLNHLNMLEASVQKVESSTNTNANMINLVKMHRDHAMNNYEKYLLHDDRSK